MCGADTKSPSPGQGKGLKFSAALLPIPQRLGTINVPPSIRNTASYTCTLQKLYYTETIWRVCVYLTHSRIEAYVFNTYGFEACVRHASQTSFHVDLIGGWQVPPNDKPVQETDLDSM